jgi:integrase
MPDHTFTLTRFENRNGAASWRVSGWIAGVRIRKNFKKREDAAAEKAALEIRALQATSGMRQAMTFLTDDELRQAETAVRRLAGQPHGLAFFVDFALANYRDPAREKSLDDAITAFLEARRRDEAHRLVSPRQLRSTRHELENLQKHFPKFPVSALTPAAISDYLDRGYPAPKTYNNRRGIVGTFLKFAFQRDWIESNPMLKVPHRRTVHGRGEATTISAEQAAQLMAAVEDFADGILVPYFALCLFAGIRPSVDDGEISKLRPDQIRLEEGVIRVGAETSKVRMKRHVAILPNLAAWLRAYPIGEYAIVPRNAKNYRRRICDRFGLSHDVLRHTFISMHVAKFRSIGEAALQAGNSEAIIRKHYLDVKTKEEAERFFSIMPKRGAVPQAVPSSAELPFPEPSPAFSRAG